MSEKRYIYCMNCGTKNEPGAKFCKACGAKLLEQTQTPTDSEKTENIESLTDQKPVEPTPEAQETKESYATETANDSMYIEAPEPGYGEIKEKVAASAKKAGEQAQAAAKQAGIAINNVKENEKVKKNGPIIGIIAGIAVALLLVFRFTPLAEIFWPTVDLNKYSTLSITGTAPNGSAMVITDWNQMASDYKQLQGTLGNSKTDSISIIDYLSYAICPTPSVFAPVSNGDTIEYSWVIPDNIPKDIHVKFSGEPQKTEVTGLSTYLNTCDQVPEEIQGKIDLAAKAYYGNLQKNFYSSGTSTITSFEHVGNVVGILKDPSVNPLQEDTNQLYSVYKLTIHDHEDATSYSSAYDKDWQLYWYIAYSNIIVESNGDVDLDVNSITKNANDYVEKNWIYHYGYESINKLMTTDIEDNSNYKYDSNIDVEAISAADTANTSTTTSADGVIGTVTINVPDLNSRSTASTSGDKLGKVKEGSTYDVYETTTGEGYTWYRIGDNKWIAGKDNWVTYEAK